MKICRKYPVSLDEYSANHEKKNRTLFIECRYQKACFIYSAFKYAFENSENREIAKSYKDLISKPIDAFNIWWDV